MNLCRALWSLVKSSCLMSISVSFRCFSWWTNCLEIFIWLFSVVETLMKKSMFKTQRYRRQKQRNNLRLKVKMTQCTVISLCCVCVCVNAVWEISLKQWLLCFQKQGCLTIPDQSLIKGSYGNYRRIIEELCFFSSPGMIAEDSGDNSTVTTNKRLNTEGTQQITTFPTKSTDSLKK